MSQATLLPKVDAYPFTNRISYHHPHNTRGYVQSFDLTADGGRSLFRVIR